MTRPALLALLLVAACAPSHPHTLPPATPHDELARYEKELLRLQAELDSLSAQAQPPGCERIVLLRDNICTLAARICRLADEHPAETALPPRCTDARLRCTRAAETSKQRGCPS